MYKVQAIGGRLGKEIATFVPLLVYFVYGAVSRVVLFPDDVRDTMSVADLARNRVRLDVDDANRCR